MPGGAIGSGQNNNAGNAGTYQAFGVQATSGLQTSGLPPAAKPDAPSPKPATKSRSPLMDTMPGTNSKNSNKKDD